MKTGFHSILMAVLIAIGLIAVIDTAQALYSGTYKIIVYSLIFVSSIALSFLNDK